MPRKVFSVMFQPANLSDERDQRIYIKLYTHIPDLLVETIQEACFSVDTKIANGLLALTPWHPVSREENILAAIYAIEYWHRQYCGYSATYSRSELKIMSNVPQIGDRKFLPPKQNAPLRRIGELRAKLQETVVSENFTEAAEVRDKLAKLWQTIRRPAGHVAVPDAGN